MVSVAKVRGDLAFSTVHARQVRGPTGAVDEHECIRREEPAKGAVVPVDRVQDGRVRPA